MTYSIKHLFHINASKEKVFGALTTMEGLANWWTNKVNGDCNDGGIIQFRFGDYGGPDMKVKEIKPNESVTWECVGENDGWLGHIFTFYLDTNENKTRLRFEQTGWKKPTIFMPPAILVGEDIWKACGSFAKQERVKPLEVRGTGNNFSKKASHFFTVHY